jgi:hypothetical protein
MVIKVITMWKARQPCIQHCRTRTLSDDAFGVPYACYLQMAVDCCLVYPVSAPKMGSCYCLGYSWSWTDSVDVERINWFPFGSIEQLLKGLTWPNSIRCLQYTQRIYVYFVVEEYIPRSRGEW